MLVSRVLKLGIVHSQQEAVMNNLYRSLILIMLWVFVSLPLLAAETDEAKLPWWVETQAVSGKHPSKVIVWYEKDLTDRFGFYALAEKESADGYTQSYVGPKFKFSDHLTLGVGIGRETMTGLSGVRRNVYYDANWGKFSSFGTKETGPSGPWHKVTVTYAVNERWGVGLIDETDLGRGPRVEYNFANKTQLWIGIPRNRDTKETAIVLGINISF